MNYPFFIKTFACCCLALVTGRVVQAQFAPQASVPGSTAIPYQGTVFANWANKCSIVRGYMDIAQPGMGKVTAGDSTNALGAPDNFIVSLGDSGIAILQFPKPIVDGPGADFAVFENGFADPQDAEQAFLELAFVEVSSDGINYFRFPATSNTPLSPQIPQAGVYMNARLINNLAGKYISGYGTPFDLQELAGAPGLDVNHVTHVRLVDVIGDVSGHGSVDNLGNPINDPYPTILPTGGFDLDAVGVLHQEGGGDVAGTNGESIVQVYPNPATEQVYIAVPKKDVSALLMTVSGSILYQGYLPDGRGILGLTEVPAGMYCIILQDKEGNRWMQRITKL